METRRSFLVKSAALTGAAKILAGTSLVGGLAFLEGCSASDWLQEASNIITLIGPLGDGVLAIVEIADPALAPGLQVIDLAYDAAYQAVAKYLADEAAALKSAQPGAIGQLESFVGVLKNDATNLVSGVAGIRVQPYEAEISSLTNAITGEVNAILSVIPQIKAGVKNVKVPPVQSAKELRKNLVKHFSSETGNARLDAVRTALAIKLNKLDLK